jgi:hypothetical protein
LLEGQAQNNNNNDDNNDNNNMWRMGNDGVISTQQTLLSSVRETAIDK